MHPLLLPDQLTPERAIELALPTPSGPRPAQAATRLEREALELARTLTGLGFSYRPEDLAWLITPAR